MTQPDGRRGRVALKRKIKCNREKPCSNCLRAKSETCVYGSATLHSPGVYRNAGQNQPNGRILAPRTKASSQGDLTSSTNGSEITRSTHPSSLTSTSTPGIYQDGDEESARLRARIRHLEEQVSRSSLDRDSGTHLTSNANIESASSRLGGTMHITFDKLAAGQPQVIVRNIVHKTRLLGQSHWGVHGILIIRDIFETLEPQLQTENSNVVCILEKCKSLARVIKARRAPPWPCPPTPDLPSKEIADTLVDNYLRSSESIYRILHIPTFRRDYEFLWVSNTTPNMAFLVQLKLVLALGALTFDNTFSLRESALRWVYEAQTWVSEPKFKSRLDIPSLQTNLLLLLAQEGVGSGGDNMWISIGAVLRKAMFMGLHKDPTFLPPMPTFSQEMRRRLWNTIIELALQSSLTSGGAPLISLEDFSTAPPGNFDDDQLVVDQAIPKTENEYTQMSLSVALRRTFPQRLAVVKFLNDTLLQGTYENTLRLDADLRASYKVLRESLQLSCNSDKEGTASQAAITILNFLLNRYSLALHVPYFGPALQEASYAYSRKVVVESALKIWHCMCPESRSLTNTVQPNNSTWLFRLTTCSSGFYPTVAIQAVLLIGLELRAHIQEDDGLGHAPLRPDLLSVLEDGLKWCMEVIEAGETNIKGCLLISLVVSHVGGLRERLGPEVITRELMNSTEDILGTCLGKLEERAASYGYGGAEGNEEERGLTTPSDAMEDWSFMMSDAFGLGGGSMDAMNWMFD
ncbi:C6 transcription factor [Pochonia chlamydosporia 170]|uniref:C6 transcription factor n=1 Tax=Pochonia chlamydosporia 170 TaxID=1380566 RepID=A0A179F599_METCM|nr:C6 transcription factor [Pochonia chlamydosporia 170]OAQ60606.2 C6 transcription factor [Pochonia chlamydosporia 170]